MRKKKAPIVKPDRTLGVLEALEARARATGRGEREARGRYNVTSIRNEHDAIFDAQRDRAQVRDAIARVRARAR